MHNLLMYTVNLVRYTKAAKRFYDSSSMLQSVIFFKLSSLGIIERL